MSKINVGLTGWNEEVNTGKKKTFDDSDQTKFEYIRLKDGLNLMRIITDPYKYFNTRFKGPLDKTSYGRRVNTAWPTYKGECPAVDVAGLKPKPRYLVGIIDRDDDDKVKLFDMSVMVYDQLKIKVEEAAAEWAEDHEGEERTITPQDFDITVKFNPKSSTPAGWYNVGSRSIKPLKENQQAIVEEFGEALNDTLVRYSACPKPDRVRKRLEDLGWDGNPVVVETEEEAEASTSEGSGEVRVSASSDETLDFSKPPPSAQAAS